MENAPKLGARLFDDGKAEFLVWAPNRERVDMKLDASSGPTLPMKRMDRGYFFAQVDGLAPGTRFYYQLDGQIERPDPATRFQPDGIRGPSALERGRFPWTDEAWRGIPLDQHVIYELHVGTFTPVGTFEAIVPRLEALKDLGVTAIELMPVAEFPGRRNWGYDGVFPGSVHSQYGGPQGFKSLVNAAHGNGLAVILDVVYNHLGPEGNVLNDFGPYFTDRYKTPWGQAPNFDGPDSDEVRRYFIEASALRFLDEYHVDGLRIDAIHAIADRSAYPFLEELGDRVRRFGEEQGRQVWTFPESDLNDPRVVDRNVIGLDAAWTDDFHHALHTVLTGERSGYYADFRGVADVATAMKRGYVYAGEYSPVRRRRHGAEPAGLHGSQFVVAAQTHDQVGNRALGERLSALVDFESEKLAAGVLLLAPFVPLIFMGQEYGESAPFQYFISHADPRLIEAVRKGRRAEFADFAWPDELPGPDDEATFERSKIDWDLREQGRHSELLGLYHDLLSLRREVPALASLDLDAVTAVADPEAGTVVLDRGAARAFFNFAVEPRSFSLPEGRWRLGLSSSPPNPIDPSGTIELAAHSFVLLLEEPGVG